MGLLDEVLAAQTAAPKQCKTGKLLNKLPKTDAADLQAALANPNVQTEVLVRVLVQRGHQVSASQLGTHRRGECCCVVSG